MPEESLSQELQQDEKVIEEISTPPNAAVAPEQSIEVKTIPIEAEIPANLPPDDDTFVEQTGEKYRKKATSDKDFKPPPQVSLSQKSHILRKQQAQEVEEITIPENILVAQKQWLGTLTNSWTSGDVFGESGLLPSGMPDKGG